MRHKDIAKLLGAYLGRELTLEERNIIEAHLQRCAMCREEIDAPPVQVYSAFLAPVPPPPPPPAKKRPGSQTSARIKPIQTQPMMQLGKLIAPVEISQKIAEELVSDFGVEGGVEGSVEGGVVGGDRCSP